MADALAVVGKIVEIGKTLRGVAELVKDAKTKSLIADLNLAISDLKMQIVDLRDENLALKDKLKRGAAEKDLASALELKEVAYWFKVAPGDRPPGPYCTGCFDAGRKLSLLRPLPETFRAFGTHECPVCKATYGAGEF